ncbi:hypothetical protein JHK85_027607 [Glycine max]|nr:hypothetical protein JHK85_027607 [Glycine max]KHN39087.1 hypothetical protein glysoja_017381 [Glycine soja]
MNLSPLTNEGIHSTQHEWWGLLQTDTKQEGSNNTLAMPQNLNQSESPFLQGLHFLFPSLTT